MILVDLRLKDGESFVDTSHTSPIRFFKLDTAILPTDASVVVLVTDAVSPFSFFLQVFDETAAVELSTLSAQLQEFVSMTSPLSSVTVGELCCAQFSQDGLWYRARVVEICTNSIIVTFIDFGNCEEMSLSSIRPFQQEFFRLPAQAVVV